MWAAATLWSLQCSEVRRYMPMNFKVAWQLFNIAVSLMKFTKFATSLQLKVIEEQNHSECIPISAAMTNKWMKDWQLVVVCAHTTSENYSHRASEAGLCIHHSIQPGSVAVTARAFIGLHGKMMQIYWSDTDKDNEREENKSCVDSISFLLQRINCSKQHFHCVTPSSTSSTEANISCGNQKQQWCFSNLILRVKGEIRFQFSENNNKNNDYVYIIIFSSESDL